VERWIITWLRGHEGFAPRSKTGSGYRWERDDHWATKVRIALSPSGGGGLQGMRTVTHRRTDIGDAHQLVELDIDAALISTVAKGIAGGAIGLGTVGGIAAALGTGDAATFLAAFLPTVAVGLSAAIITAKSWAGTLRRGLDRALDAITSPELHAIRRRTGVLGDISKAIETLFR